MPVRVIETILCIINLAGLFLILIPKLSKRRPAFRIGALLSICALQIFLEGARWQMFPAYLFSLISCLIWIVPTIPVDKPRGAKWRRGVGRLVAGFVLLAVYVTSVALPTMIPVFTLPKPDGHYAIGTTVFHWVDSSRQEIFDTDSSVRRELMVQVWYPADMQQTGTYDPYASDAASLSAGLASALSANGLVRVPSFFFEHFRYVRTNALQNVPVVRGHVKFPILLYLSGLDGFRQSGMSQVEHLVSHGYIVVGVDQPYASACVSFPDGRIIMGYTRPQMQPLIDQSLAPLPDPPILQGRMMPAGIIPYFAQDVSFVLDKLMSCEGCANALKESVDLDRLGIFGVSLGAMVAAQASLTDLRLKATLMMDAAMPEEVAKGGLGQPVMFLTRSTSDMRLERMASGGWSEKDIEQTLSTQREVYNKARQRNGYFVRIAGMFHINFTDAPHYSPVMPGLGLVGPIDSEKGFEIVNAYTLAFFDHTLKQERSPLLVREINFPGVTLDCR